jgi:hypothetical protein
MNKRNLILKCRDEINLPPSLVREIIQSIETSKITRSFLNDEDLYACSQVFDELGLKMFISSVKFLTGKDLGKGGYSNSIAKTTSANSAEGFYRVHIGTNEIDVALAKQMDEDEDDLSLGKLLDIPDCCIKKFLEYQPKAKDTQNDYTLAIKGGLISPWVNICGQYFGYGLVSYFPCSPFCKHTIEQSRNNLNLLSGYSEEFAKDFIKYQFTDYIYSEYDGVHMIENGTYSDKQTYKYKNSAIESSSRNLLSEMLRKGNRLSIRSPSDFSIYSQKSLISNISSELVKLFIFDRDINFD